MPIKTKHNGNDARKRIWCIIVACALVVASIAIAFPPQEKINQGLDIQGGLSVVLSANPTNGQDVTSDDMETAKEIIEKRINALGASEATVQIQSGNQILVQIPGMSDSSAALEAIGKTGVLEFARVDSFTDDTVKSDLESGNIVDYSKMSEQRTGTDADAPTGASTDKGTLADTENYPHITVDEGTYDIMTTGDHITNVTVGKESSSSPYYAVNITMDQEGTEAWREATTDLAPTHGKIAIILDGEVNSAPATQSVIDNGQIAITGNYTLEQAQALQTVLDSGSLPVSFTYEQSQTVGPTLGHGELEAGLLAMLAGIALVMVYLLVFYRGFGIIAALNMVVFSAIYMGVLGLLSRAGVFSLSLAGIAGIILSIGTAADSAVLSIEKFKEQLKEGHTIKSASINGVKHAVITSLDADVVSALSALALFIFASSSVKGFGLTLLLGIICDIIVMLLFIAPSIRLLAPRIMRAHPGFWGIRYALELGDTRTGSNNLVSADQVKEENKARHEEKKKQAEYEKKTAQKKKDIEKASSKRAKEIRKEDKQKLRDAKRAVRSEMREEDAAKKKRRAADKSARKEAHRAEKENDRNSKKNHVAKRSSASESTKNTSGKLSESKTLDATTAVIGSSSDTSSGAVKSSNIEEKTKLVKPDTVNERDEDEMKEYSKKEAESEVDKFLKTHDASTVLSEDGNAGLKHTKESDGMVTSGPDESANYGVVNGRAADKRTGADDSRSQGAPHMNRAQRRAAEKQARSKKNR